MKIHETVVSIEGKDVTRIRSSAFYLSGVASIVLGVILVANEVYIGLTLILVVAPFVLMYPLIRALMLGKDSIGVVLVTAFLDYWLNKKLRSDSTKDSRSQ